MQMANSATLFTGMAATAVSLSVDRGKTYDAIASSLFNWVGLSPAGDGSQIGRLTAQSIHCPRSVELSRVEKRGGRGTR